MPYSLKRIFLVLVILFPTTILAQQSLLWQITGNGLKDTSYLFATIHIQDKRVFQFGDSVMTCFNSCKTMAGEVVLDKSNGQEVLAAMRMPGDTTLKTLLKKKDYRFVKKTVRKKYGALYTLVINKIKPVYTALLLLEEKPDKKEKKDEMDVFLDQYFQQKALNKGMAVKGLETAAEQLKALEVMSLKEQADYLIEQLRDTAGSSEKILENMIQAYLTQNLDSLYSYFVDQELPQDMMESLLLNRNKVMMTRMEPMMKENATFIAVGAAHLPGEKGLIRLLKENGYTVRPVECRKKSDN